MLIYVTPLNWACYLPEGSVDFIGQKGRIKCFNKKNKHTFQDGVNIKMKTVLKQRLTLSLPYVMTKVTDYCCHYNNPYQ